MSNYQITSTGNRIIADQAFMDAQHAGDYTLLPDSPLPVDPTTYFIDVGPFMDRFTSVKLAVLTSTDATVKAIVQDMMARKWIDLQRADVASSLAYIGSVVAALTPAIQTAILATPVSAEENLALRKLYFS